MEVQVRSPAHFLSVKV